MKVLILGSGGREHALAWKIRKSQHVSWLGVAPGNGGTRSVAETVELDINDIEAVRKYIQDQQVHLTIVGPEAPLVAGVADGFEKEGQFIFGPTSSAARIEGNKRFAKELMDTAGIPTSNYRAFSNYTAATKYLDGLSGPCVIKASGLAAGKGVVVCGNVSQAQDVLKKFMIDRIHGAAGDEVVIEERLEGQEASILAITDGTNYLVLPPSQDHKRIGEGDTGPNTGGMGAYAPASAMTDELVQQAANEIIEPALKVMRESGMPYKGLLYVGLMLTAEGPKVLEFNCRFGDPETQAVLPLLSVDLVDLMLVSVTGKLGEMSNALGLQPTQWQRLSKTGSSATVVLAAEGYPGSYPKGMEISGLPEDREDLVVFHAGTRWEEEKLVSSGGRVLAVTGLDNSLQGALGKVYQAADAIRFDNKYYRKDIGHRAM